MTFMALAALSYLLDRCSEHTLVQFTLYSYGVYDCRVNTDIIMLPLFCGIHAKYKSSA